jgi:hypothetical protein
MSAPSNILGAHVDRNDGLKSSILNLALSLAITLTRRISMITSGTTCVRKLPDYIDVIGHNWNAVHDAEVLGNAGHGASEVDAYTRATLSYK